MSTNPTNFAEAAWSVHLIKTQTASATARIATNIRRMTDIRVELDAMETAFPNGWLNAVQFIDEQANASPQGDTAWRDLQAIKDKLVTDFRAQQTRAVTIEAALSGL